MVELTDTSDVPGPIGDPPDFDDWEDPEQLFNDRSTGDRILDVMVQVRKPTDVSTIADRADCDTETARNYLRRFADVGLVREHDGRSVRYQWNKYSLR